MKTLKTLYRSVKAAATGEEFSGYGGVCGNLDRHGDIIAPGAFKEALPGYLSNGGMLLWQHGDDDPIGQVLEASEDAFGLKVGRARVTDATDEGKKARALLADGAPLAMSIGYICKSSLYLDGASAVNGFLASIGRASIKEQDCPKWGVRVIQSLELLEISLVSIPANPLARVTGVKSHKARGYPNAAEAVRAVRRWAAHQQKAGRSPSDSSRTRLSALRDSMRACAEELDALVAEDKGAAAALETKARLLRARAKSLSLSAPLPKG